MTVTRLYIGVSCALLFSFHTGMAENYWTDREQLVKEDGSYFLGSSIILSEQEQKANRILMEYKTTEITEGFYHPEKYLAGQNFLKVKDQIDKSEVFDIMKKLPKGSSLHSHDMAITSGDFLYKLTFEPNLFASINKDQLSLRFFDANYKDCNWTLVSKLRSSDPEFENFLKSRLTLIVDNPDEKYANVNTVWTAFNNIFGTVIGMLTYKPIWQKYFYQALKELYEDNVRYLELRSVLPDLYDLDGKIYNASGVVESYYETLLQFKKDYPDFWGARFIYAPLRKVTNQTMHEYVDIFKDLKKRYPEIIAGFDLVGQEDLGHSLMSFADQLLALKESGAEFFFHAGETNWCGFSTDSNLFDAILLGTRRIGHGYAILKHPGLAKLVKEKQIALEISPISNQVLRLVNDIRNHPASVLIANNFPMVISCDDPSFWGAKGLSYDWYVAFMGLASKEADLRFLKQLAINSLIFSSMEKEEKRKNLQKWEKDWNTFINDLLLEHNIV